MVLIRNRLTKEVKLMEIGIVGLGKMGLEISHRLMDNGHLVVGYDRNPEAWETLQGTRSFTFAHSLGELVEKLSRPRVVWIMVPAGEATEKTIETLEKLLSEGDTIIDGGNSNYKDTIRRAKTLKEKHLQLLDVGTSGGIWGRSEGFSLMIGGDRRTVETLAPIFEALAPSVKEGWGHVGTNGAGHFVKMIHNGIEYGLMQAYAEGFDIMKAKTDLDLDLHQVAEIWRFGSVIRSWLLDLISDVLEENPGLHDTKAWVADSGEGRWTVFEAIDLDVPAPVITQSLQARFVSRRKENYSAKLLAAIRNRFGGHTVMTEEHDEGPSAAKDVES
ncbi:MAG TPA: decarboxylating 6-phosphogluconate dehydrogenase [Kosmotogaceae bacterium]|nr:decarboxylating 6-phosphogluconate dehydrogenase [Kosmotogaceae bacterium]